MASQSQGIQLLLQAEKRAAEKVKEARKAKAKKLKQAKEEAQSDILKYRQEREQQFKEQEAKVIGSRSDAQAVIVNETNRKINELEQRMRTNREGSLKKLLDGVFDVKIDLHRNYDMQKKLVAPSQTA